MNFNLSFCRLVYNLFLLFIVIISSCSTNKDECVYGYWIALERNNLNIESIQIQGKNVILEDFLRNNRSGTILNDNLMSFKIGNNHLEYLSFEMLSDSSLSIGSVHFEKSDSWLHNELKSQEFKILGLNTDVIFPFKGYENEKWLKIKLRNQDYDLPLILGVKISSIEEISSFAPSSICSGGVPRKISYDGALIVVEDNSSPKDLLVLEQLLFLEHRLFNFVIVTDELTLNSYHSVTDNKYVSVNIYNDIRSDVNKHLDKSFLLPPPPPSSLITFEEEVFENHIHLVKFESYSDFQNSGHVVMSKYRDNLVTLSTDMEMEEYLSILNALHVYKDKKGYSIKTHFLD